MNYVGQLLLKFLKFPVYSMIWKTNQNVLLLLKNMWTRTDILSLLMMTLHVALHVRFGLWLTYTKEKLQLRITVHQNPKISTTRTIIERLSLYFQIVHSIIQFFIGRWRTTYDCLNLMIQLYWNNYKLSGIFPSLRILIIKKTCCHWYTNKKFLTCW